MFPPDSFPLKNTTVRIPSRGLGTFQVDPTLYPDNSVKDSVLQALRLGYRHIDAAFGYGWGSVEREIGEAIRESGIPRDELFIVTKLHNCFHKPEDVAINMDMSLENFGLSYVDLYLMHFPYAYAITEGYGTQRTEDGKPVIDIPRSRAYDATWTAMERLVDDGKAKLIGVSNFSSPKLERLLKTARIHPVVNQVEIHPYFPQKGLVEYCQAKEIHVTAHCPLGGAPIPVLIGRKGPGPLEDSEILRIAAKYNKTPAQVILCHTICRGISVIPKTNNTRRIVENFDILFDLSDDDFLTIDRLVGERGEHGVRNLETRDYLGFDNFNELIEEP
ncbi:Aldo/keto reductase [Aspergillus keveii]|uniref:D-xylose reductase [NAD(P)H] n=1 Tax=Aspergillus keveii TaxID=714993 RepID=A0ABR4FTA2_9EURO